jgi:cephalosporin hydroxylase
MIKKIAIASLFLVLFSCSSTKPPLISAVKYDVLFGSDYGGAAFQFYEIISEKDEFNILLTDDMIKPYVKKEDIETCNFILVNMGEKKSEGYTLKVQKVEELPDKIIITLKEIEPRGTVTQVTTKPCYVLKIKSKKPIEIK